jgi:hypothetical protein
MAANDYFNSSSNFDQRFQDNNPPPPPPSSAKPAPIYTSPNSVSPSPYQSYGGRHANRDSQNTLFSEPDYYSGGHGGRGNGSDQYADDIPLKSNARHSGQGPWMNENTQYPPSPESQRLPPMDNSSTHEGRSRRKKFFKKKIPWVVYVTTLAQIIVFIVEIVRNGMLQPSSRFSKTNPSSQPKRLVRQS